MTTSTKARGKKPFAYWWTCRIAGRQSRIPKNRLRPTSGRSGNLRYSVSNSDLEQLSSPFGTVVSVQVIEDRDSGKTKGFGFVEMGSDEETQSAISGLEGTEQDG